MDAPLWWASGRSGARLADEWLRRRYGLKGGQVQAVNSLRGAALAQAAVFVQRMRDSYPAVPVTENHPKALLKAWAHGEWKTLATRMGIDAGVAVEHERDALTAAVAAREGFEGRWPHDLAAERHQAEQDPHTYWLAPVHYFWPE